MVIKFDLEALYDFLFTIWFVYKFRLRLFLVFFVFIVFLADALRLVAVLLVSARGETFAVFFLGILNILAD